MYEATYELCNWKAALEALSANQWHLFLHGRNIHPASDTLAHAWVRAAVFQYFYLNLSWYTALSEAFSIFRKNFWLLHLLRWTIQSRFPLTPNVISDKPWSKMDARGD